MNDINSVVIVGRLTRDAELKSTAGGYAVCKFSIASNYWKKVGDKWEEQANFFDVVLWGRAAEACAPLLTKGRQVVVNGELRQERWEQDGKPRSRVEIIADNVQLIGPRSPDGKPNESSPQKAGNDFSDDIPF